MDNDFKWKAETAIIPPDVIIERQGQTIVRIIKSGVVIWGQEPHNAGMEPTGQELAKALHMKEASRQQRANDSMVGGTHYKNSDAVGTCPHCRKEVEHWDWSHNLRGLEYAITKYIARWRSKGGLESLKKVIHYTQKLIEIHFPGVGVSVSYSNTIDPRILGARSIDNGKAGSSEGVAPGTPTHQTAVGQASPNYTADRFPRGGRDNY